MSWNPISRTSWLYNFVEENPPESFILTRSTYKDNKWLTQDYVAALEELRVRNPAKAKVFCDGEWGVDAEGLVFQNWKTEKLDQMELAKKFERRAGMDFGWQDPSAIVETYYDKENKTIYITREFYRSGQTLDELYSAIERMNLKRIKLWCDSADPRAIDYFVRQSCRAVPCIKGQNSVQARIAFIQNHLLIVDPSCTNVIRELENFSYIKDRDGRWTDKTTHEYSHSLDALCYQYSDLYSKGTLRTLDKSVLGL